MAEPCNACPKWDVHLVTRTLLQRGVLRELAWPLWVPSWWCQLCFQVALTFLEPPIGASGCRGIYSQ